MDSCWPNDARKEEWQKLRLLRLRQVQEQSKQVSKAMMRMTEEKRLKQKAVIKEKRQDVLQEWKKAKIDELEEQYKNAMEQVGLAARQAEIENASEEVLLAKEEAYREAARRRGKFAEQVQLEKTCELIEKENAPIRRKQMTREIEDIRSGLVVQSRDWNVINQTQRKVLSERQPSTGNAPARERFALPKSSAPKSSHGPKSVTGKKLPNMNSARPSSSPLRVPAFTENLEELGSSSRPTTIETTSQRPPETDLPNFNPTYRISKCPCPPEVSEQAPESVAVGRTASAPKSKPSEIAPSCLKLNDEELNTLLERYRPCSSKPQPIPCTRNMMLNLTPPTHEHGDESSPHIRSRKRAKRRNRRNSGAGTSETKKLFAAIDKALERGRRMRGEVTDNGSSPSESSPSSDDDGSESEAVVKLIVNVNCQQPGYENFGVDCPLESHPNGAVVKRKRSCATERENTQSSSGWMGTDQVPTTEVCEKRGKETKNVSTEVGESLQASDSTHPTTTTTQSTECSGGKDSCDSRVQVPSRLQHYVHYLQEPVKRTSTVEDLSLRTPSKGASIIQSMTDLSSIVDDSPQKEPPPKLLQDVQRGTRLRGEKDLSLRSLSSTVYLDIEDKLKGAHLEEEKSFKVNPVLDYYIRKLLDKPVKLGSGRSSECCKCPRVQPAASSEHLTEIPSARVPDFSRPKSRTDFSSEIPRQLPTSLEINVPVARRIEDGQVNADQLKRSEKIAELERQLGEIRRTRIISSSSSGRSSSSSTTIGSSPDSERLGVPPDGNHRLSTILEMDSRIQADEPDGTDKVKTRQLPPSVAYLLERNLINRPFSWVLEDSTASTSSHLSADDEAAELDFNASRNVPPLDFSSILSLTSENNVADRSAGLSSRPPGINLSQSLSRLDLTNFSSVFDQK